MDVQCKKCGAEYTLDETLVASSGTSVRCTKCDYVFRVYRSAGRFDDQDEWHIRKKTGKTFAVERIGILQRMIADGRISADDAISRSGGPWKRIGDIPEMQPFFEATRLGKMDTELQKTKHRTTMKNLAMPSHKQSSQSGPGESSVPNPPVSGQTEGFPPRAVPPAVTAKPIESIALGSRADARGSVGIYRTAIASSKRTDPPPGPVPAPAVVAQRPKAPLAVPVERPKMAPPKTENPPAVHEPVPGHPSSVVPEPRRAGPSEMPTSPGFQEKDGLDFSQIPATRDEHTWGSTQNGVSSAPAGPAWAERSSALHRFDSVAKPLPARKKRIGRWIVAFFVIGAAIGSFYMFRFQRPVVEKLLGDFLTSSNENRYQKFFDRGREAFLLDSETYYVRADREFQKVLALEEGHAPTLAALAETQAVWAQSLIDAEIDLTDAADSPDGEKPEDAARLDKEITEKIAEASRWADQALQADPSLPEAHRAKADVLRLSGKIDEAAQQLASAGGEGADPETAYVSIMTDLDRGVATDELIRRLDGVLQQQTLIRAMYRKARFLANEGQAAAAKDEIEHILELNSEHDRAKNLLQRINEKRAVALRLEKVPTDVAVVDQEETEQDNKDVVHLKEEDTSHREAAGGGESLIKQAERSQKRGRTQTAIKLYKKALDRDPGNKTALSGLAYCYLDAGASGRAIALFRRVLQSDRRHGPSLIGLATTFKAQGQKDLALKYFKQYIEKQPSGPQAALAKRNIADLEDAPSKAVESNSAKDQKNKAQKPEQEDDEQEDASASKSDSQAGDDGNAPVGVKLPDEAPGDAPSSPPPSHNDTEE